MVEFQESAQLEGIAKSKVQLGLLYYETGMEREALEKMKSLSKNEISLLSTGEKGNYFLIYAYFSAALDIDFRTAIAYGDSLVSLHKRHNPENIAIHYLDLNNIIEIHTLKGDTAKAWEMIRSMESNPVESKGEFYRHQMNVNKARLFFVQENLDSALRYAKAILADNYTEYSDSYNRILAYQIMMRCDSLSSNLKDYINVRNKHDHLKYEILGNGAKYRIAVVKGRNEAEKFLRDAEHKRLQHRSLVALLLSIFLLVGVSVFYRFRANRARHKIALLECDRLDAEAFKRKLQCEILDKKVKEQLAELSRVKEENVEINRQLAQYGDLMEGKSRMEKMNYLLKTEHKDFLKTLSERYPNLSENDYLLLGLVRMGIPSKEIAAIMSITPDSLMKARYRLRKKMNLEKSDDLNALVMEIK